MVGDGQGIAVGFVAELKFALVIGAPQIVGRKPLGERRSGGVAAFPAHALDQAMTIEDSMDGAFGGHTRIAGKPPDEQFADLARAPMGLVALGADDQAFDLLRQLVGVAHRPSGTVGEGLEPVVLIAIENLVTGLARDAELPAERAHLFAIQKACNKAQAFVHNRTLFPWHPHLPPVKTREKCYPCVRYELSPMSQAAQSLILQGYDAVTVYAR